MHNARSIIQITLLLVQIFELAEAYLAVEITITESITISPLQITYVWMSFISTIALIAFVRICELYDKSGEKDRERERGRETNMCESIIFTASK